MRSQTLEDVYRRARLFVDDRPKGKRIDPDRLSEPKFLHPQSPGSTISRVDLLVEPKITRAHAPSAASADQLTFGPTGCTPSAHATSPVSG